MPVVLDPGYSDTGTTGGTTSTTASVTHTTLTLGATADGIIAGLLNSSSATPTAAAVTWNAQSLSQIGSMVLATGKVLYWFGGVGATVTGNTGNHNLVGSVTNAGTMTDLYIIGRSFTGVSQTFASAFTNFATSGPTTGTGPQNLAVTSTANSMVIAGWYNEAGAAQFNAGTSSPNASTQFWEQASLSSNVEAQYANGAATETMQATTSTTSVTWIAAGFSIDPPGLAGVHKLPMMHVGNMIGWRLPLAAAAGWRIAKAIKNNGKIARRRLILPKLDG